MSLIAFILILIAGGMFYYHAKGDEKEYNSAKKFFKALCFGVVRYYYKGTPTRVVMFTLQCIMMLYSAAAIGYPIGTAIINVDAEHKFYSILLQCQWDDFSSHCTYIFLGAIVLIVIVYLITRNYETEAEKKLLDNSEATLQNVESIQDSQNVILANQERIMEMLQPRSNSATMRSIFLSFEKDIKTLQVASAYRHLVDIYDSLLAESNNDEILLATLQCTLGMCALYIKNVASKPHYEEAYRLIQKNTITDTRLYAQILEGLIGVACKERDYETARGYTEALKAIDRKNKWGYVLELIEADDLNATYQALPDDINKFDVLTNAIMIGCKAQDYQLGIDIETYTYQGLQELTYDNFPTWVFEMSIAATRFVRKFEIRQNLHLMWNKEAEDLYQLTHTYLELMKKTELDNLLPDTVFLENLTGYMKDQDAARITQMETEKSNAHFKELYYLGYAMMLMDQSQYTDALKLLKEYNGKPLSSILNMRLTVAMRIGDERELIAVVKEVAIKKLHIPNHLLPNYMQVFNLVYPKVKQYAKGMVINDARSKNLFDQFLRYKARKKVNIKQLQADEPYLFIALYPFLAMIYKDRLGVDTAITLLKNCIDMRVVDLRTYLLVEYYNSERRFGVELYHLLHSIRLNGNMVDMFLRQELSMAEVVHDSKAEEEIAATLLKMHPDEPVWMCYYLKALQENGKREELISRKEKVMRMELTDVQMCKMVAGVYAKIQEYAYVIEFLYQRILQTRNQKIKDLLFELSLNRHFGDIVCNTKEVVEMGDWVVVKIDNKDEAIEITPGSTYAGLIGKRVGESKVLRLSEPTEVQVLEIRNKYFMLYEEIHSDISLHKSSSIISVSIDDEKWKGDPLAAIFAIVGKPDKSEDSRRQTLEEQYKIGRMPLLAFVKEDEPVASMLNLLFDEKFNVCHHTAEYYKSLIKDGEQINEQDVVLDLTTLIMMYYIDKKHGVKLGRKFIIPISLQVLLRATMTKEDIGTPSQLNHAVCDAMDDERFDQKNSLLWHIAQDMLQWVETHCDVRIVEDRLGMSYPPKLPRLFFIDMDSIYVASKGAVLLTEDWGLQWLFNGEFISMDIVQWLRLTCNKDAERIEKHMKMIGNY